MIYALEILNYNTNINYFEDFSWIIINRGKNVTFWIQAVPIECYMELLLNLVIRLFPLHTLILFPRF